MKLRILWAILMKISFQSLKGFQRLWSCVWSDRPFTHDFVSIPKRVSEALKLLFSRGFGRVTALCVSIPKRVSEALKLEVFCLAKSTSNVSIPKRVSEALKLCCFCPFWNQNWFQSLKGFQRLWSSRDCLSCGDRTTFQSLKGFQRLWSFREVSGASLHYAFQSLKGFQRLWSSSLSSICSTLRWFQSLKGFQRLWSCCNPSAIAFWDSVSIPKRVSEALKLGQNHIAKIKRYVSIPKRVSEALKHMISVITLQTVTRFNP